LFAFKDEDGKEDIFGLPKMSTKLEIAISYVLFVLGVMMILSAVYTYSYLLPMNMIYVGLLMIGVAYVFTMEAIRELEEEDHFLSSRLMKRNRESDE